MAFLQDDKDKQAGQDPNAQPGAVQPGQPLSPGAGQGGGLLSAGGNSGVSTAGVGAGGTGGWTNIQAYLKANQGDTRSADYLNKEVGGTLDKEKNDLESSANEAKSTAQKQVDDNHIGDDKASQIIQQAGSNYSYSGGPQSQAYQSATGQLKNALGAEYAGPQNYSHGFGAQTQEYAQGLGSDEGFKGLMSSLYNKSAGGQMGTGAQSLQRQLDQDNTALNTAKSDLSNRYKALNTLAYGENGQGGLVADTDAAVKASKNQFLTDKRNLRDYIGNQAVADNEAVIKRANDINSYFQNKDRGGNYNFGYGNSANVQNASGVDRQRNEFNAIRDALGYQDRIGYTAPIKQSDLYFAGSDPSHPGVANFFNQNAASDPTDTQRWRDELAALGIV